MEFRTKISLYVSLSVNLLYSALRIISGIKYASFWYGADAIFYIALSVIRIKMLRYVRKSKRNTSFEGIALEQEYCQFRSCGCLLFVMNVAMIGVIYQIVSQNMSYQYPGRLIYAVATYTFICLTIAIINMVKYSKLSNPVLTAVKAISLSKALVAIFALQTALITTFGSSDGEDFRRLMNSLTGGFVCISIFTIAVLMVVGANKNLKNLELIIQKQNSNIS
jgi:hypothetical protein